MAGIIGSIASWVGANATAITAVASTATAVQGMENQKQAIESAKKQQDIQQKAIDEQKAIALAKRKDVINKQRRLMGAGDTNSYSVNATGATGGADMTGLNGSVLG